MTTKKMFLRPCTWVYLFLLSLTFVTWFIGVNNLSGRAFALPYDIFDMIVFSYPFFTCPV